MIAASSPVAPPDPPVAPSAAVRAHPDHPRARRPWRALLAVPAALAAVLAASWWANRPAGPGAPAIAVGQVTGLAGAVAALITVALMARVPFVTDVVGTDRTVRWHRAAGIATGVLLPIHVVATIVGYAPVDGHGAVAEVGTLLTSYPDMLTATAAALLLGVVVLTSVRAARRRLAYPSWLFVHWYSYVAVALAFGHELSTGASFAASSAAALAWTWLHLFVLGLVAWYRVVLPGWRLATHRLTVTAVEPAGAGAVTIALAGESLDDYHARPGQHLRLRLLTDDGRWESHPFSLSAVPTADRWRITVGAAGDATTALQSLPVGTEAVVSGAYGDLTPEAVAPTDGRGVALIGGGLGIVPLRALLEGLPAGLDVRVLYRARRPEDLVLIDELEALLHARHLPPVQRLLGARHPDPERDVLAPGALRTALPDLAQREVVVCGHAGFVGAVERSLDRLGLPADHLHTERFDA